MANGSLLPNIHACLLTDQQTDFVGTNAVPGLKTKPNQTKLNQIKQISKSLDEYAQPYDVLVSEVYKLKLMEKDSRSTGNCPVVCFWQEPSKGG